MINQPYWLPMRAADAGSRATMKIAVMDRLILADYKRESVAETGGQGREKVVLVTNLLEELKRKAAAKK